MEIGIFSNVYTGHTIEEGLTDIHKQGITQVQLNLSSLFGEMLPATLDGERLTAADRFAHAQGIRFVSLAGTFNLIAPDREERQEGIRRFEVLCRGAALLSIPVILLCTGSRNPASQWLWHEENASQAAWRDLLNGT